MIHVSTFYGSQYIWQAVIEETNPIRIQPVSYSCDRDWMVNSLSDLGKKADQNLGFAAYFCLKSLSLLTIPVQYSAGKQPTRQTW